MAEEEEPFTLKRRTRDGVLDVLAEQVREVMLEWQTATKGTVPPEFKAVNLKILTAFLTVDAVLPDAPRFEQENALKRGWDK